MGTWRQWLATPGGRALSIALLAIGLGAALLSLRNLSRTDAAALSRQRLFICSETGKPFEQDLRLGMRIPVRSPYSGKDTGYPAELCYWTANGKAKDQPTPVLLNSYRGSAEPTFCPECGRLVVGLNPAPEPGRRPPPTREQMQARQPGPGR